MRRFVRSAGLVGMLALGVSGLGLIGACQENASDFFGEWDEPSDGGVQDAGGDLSKPQPNPNPDGMGISCAFAFAGSAKQVSFNAPRVPDDDEDYIIPDAKCRSGWRWIGGDEESDWMQPGSDCMTCHRGSSVGRPDDDDDDDDDDSDGPPLVVAGTIYGAADEPTDCLGVQGAVVRVTGKDGQQIQMVSNFAGNFFLESKRTRLALPFTAEVMYQGRSKKMPLAQCDTSCNACHTATGENMAKGRIVLP